ncbi:MAG: RimK family alpha-L-glutamate ligase [Candidatus Nezhaarchaeota archaeon]|nr:RimK family alpha-L-glutamate ligase [Candidatus Nezhaarchaeota archaeon]
MFIAVIHDTYNPDRPCQDILKELGSRGIRHEFVRISRISSVVGGRPRFTVGPRSLDDLDGAFVRSLGSIVNTEQMVRRMTLLEHLEASGVVLMNPLEPLLTTRDKYRTLYKLDAKGIPVPKTLVCEDLRTAYEYSKRLRRVVVKPIVGSRGYGSVLIEHPEIAFRILKTLASTRHPLYVQEYIDKPARDMRVFAVDGRVIAAMYRYAPKGEWRTNIAQGGEGRPCKLEGEYEEMALKAVEALDLWYAGVDIVEGPRGPVVIEVNGSPDWEELFEVTGVNPAPFIVDCLVRKIKR